MRGNRGRPEAGAREQRPPVQDNSPEQIEDRLGMLEEDLQLRGDQRAAWETCERKIIAYPPTSERAGARLDGRRYFELLHRSTYVDIARNRLTH